MWRFNTDCKGNTVTAVQNGSNGNVHASNTAIRFNTSIIGTVDGGDGVASNFTIVSILATGTIVTASFTMTSNLVGNNITLNIVNGGKNADANGEGKIDNFKLTVKSGVQYKIAQNISLGLNVDFLSLSDKVTSSNDYTEIKGKLKLKIGF